MRFKLASDAEQIDRDLAHRRGVSPQLSVDVILQQVAFNVVKHGDVASELRPAVAESDFLFECVIDAHDMRGSLGKGGVHLRLLGKGCLGEEWVKGHRRNLHDVLLSESASLRDVSRAVEASTDLTRDSVLTDHRG